jgi:hypothetical protein
MLLQKACRFATASIPWPYFATLHLSPSYAAYTSQHDTLQVEEEDVAAFCAKLLSELSGLAQAALQAAAADDEQGLCALCGRDMPLTKHHLIPR